jgi:hypothetical protein
MSSSSSFDDSSLNEEYDQEETYRNRYKKEANEGLNALDYRTH